MPDFSDVPFASMLAYHSDPKTPDEKRSRDRMFELKQDKMVRAPSGGPEVEFSTRVAARLKSDPQFQRVLDFFGEDAVLVPVPGSAITAGNKALWVPNRLAEALRRVGVASSVETMLARTGPIRKSATAQRRPSPQEHYASFSATVGLHMPSRVVLVDDLLTLGSTALGAAARIREVLPNVPVLLFAAMRTSKWREFTDFIDPMLGTVRLSASGEPEVVSQSGASRDID